jgi:hypothetical protein
MTDNVTDAGHVQDVSLVTIDAGTLTASRDDRIITGLLLPYGEACRSNLGTFTVDPGAFTIPADVPGTVGLNVEHRREDSAGRAVTLTDTPAGIVGTFRVADTPVGDTLLAKVAAGEIRYLSVETANVRIRDGRAVSGDIFGAAAVKTPAFPSATLLAAAADTPDDAPPEDPPPAEDTPEDTPEDPETPETPPDEDPANREENPEMTGIATAPDTLHAARPAAPAVPDTGLARFNTLMAGRNRLGGDFREAMREFTDGQTLFAALSDVKISGAAGAGVMTGVQQPQFIGELWTQVAYQRRYVPLMLNAALTSLNITGWRWQDGEAPRVDTWAGNKSAVPSPAVETEAYTVAATRLAAAYDVAREFVDFDVPGWWESFWSALTASYAQKSDAKALADLVAAATPVEGAVAGSGVNQAVSNIIAGITQVSNYGTAAFGILSPELFASIASILNAGSFPYLNVGTVDFPVYGPNVTVAGIPIIPGAVGTGNALVAAREAATFHELPGSPIRVEGVYDMERGGVNPGLFGYFATAVHQPKAIALVSTDVTP